MGDYIPVYESKGSFTTSAAVTGGTLAAVSGDSTVGPAAAGSAKVIGVFATDAASGARVTIHLRGPEHEVVGSGSVTAGDQLVAAAGGKVASKAAASGATAGDINDARSIVGIALNTAADAAKVRYVAL
ncbi:capsid cement protein [Actinomadura litoris]|uniref:DUF2190 family protein n=1 Tax=Actinomadura litoris TaxID=2678616 RepID=A0A7K1LAS1_9ACTN|nr:capsid cement protein [Actinomadura litoris]MUN41413.1 DUF2190 family protein [Actinomadura litoris]